MENNSFYTYFTYHDIFATKGNEYLIVLGVLFIVILFWRFLHIRGY